MLSVRLLVYSGMLLWLAACTTTAVKTPDVGCGLDRGLSRPDIINGCQALVVAYTDTESFDTALAEALANTSTGLVNVTLSPTLEATVLSDRLNQWLTAIRESGGAVKTSNRSLAVLSALFVVLKTVWQQWQATPPDKYALAKEYDALLHVVEDNVHRISFSRR